MNDVVWFLNDDEVDGLNVALVPHADPQEEEATQRSLEFQINLMVFIICWLQILKLTKSPCLI